MRYYYCRKSRGHLATSYPIGEAEAQFLIARRAKQVITQYDHGTVCNIFVGPKLAAEFHAAFPLGL